MPVSTKYLKKAGFFKKMEIKIIEDKKDKLIFELIGGDHALCTVLKEELGKDSNVKAATYRVDHPLMSNPRILVETEGSDPRQAINNAIKKLQKTAETLSKEFKKAL